MATSIQVAARNEIGSGRIRRLRKAGSVPAVLYGGNGDSVALSVADSEVTKIIKAGSRSVQLVGSLNQAAEVKSVQWDALGTKILHVDFVRV